MILRMQFLFGLFRVLVAWFVRALENFLPGWPLIKSAGVLHVLLMYVFVTAVWEFLPTHTDRSSAIIAANFIVVFGLAGVIAGLMTLLITSVLGMRGMLLALAAHAFGIIQMYAAIYHAFGLMRGDDWHAIDSVTAVYFSIVTFTTLGYGDYTPALDIQLLAASEALAGLIIFGLFIGVAANALHAILTKNSGNSDH